MSVPILICALCRDETEQWTKQGCARAACALCRRGVWVTIPRVSPESEIRCEECGLSQLLLAVGKS